MTCLKLTAMMGFILACATMNTGARLLAAFIFVGANYSVTSITLGWVGITCAQTREKRAAALAMVNTSASISLLWSPVGGFLSFPSFSPLCFPLSLPSDRHSKQASKAPSSPQTLTYQLSLRSTSGLRTPPLAMSSRWLPVPVSASSASCASGC